MSVTSFTTRRRIDVLIASLEGKKRVDIRRAHAEFSGDVGHRRLMVADAAKVPLRYLQDARAHLVAISSHSDNRTLLGSHCCSKFRLLRRIIMDLFGSRLDAKPRGIKRRKKQQDQ